MTGREPTKRILSKEEVESKLREQEAALRDIETIERAIKTLPISSQTRLWLSSAISNRRNHTQQKITLLRETFSLTNTKPATARKTIDLVWREEFARRELAASLAVGITVDGQPI